MSVCVNTGVAQPDGHKFEFTVPSYNGLEVGQEVISNTFLCNGDTWQISVTKTDNYPYKLAVRMRLLNKSTTHNSTRIVKICYFDGSDAKTKVVFINHKVDPQSGQRDSVTFPNPFVNNLKLEVTVLKGLEVNVVETTVKPKIMEDPPNSQMAIEYLKWFQSADFGDTTVVANDGKKFRCHRDVLALRSEVFGLMFNTPMKESTENLVEIDSYDSQIVAQLLMFIYIDDCGEIGPFADRLYVAAHHYQLDRLKILCKSAMAASLSADNIVKIYRLATFYRLDKLMAACVDHLDSNKAELNISKLFAEAINVAEEPEAKIMEMTEEWSETQLKVTE